MTSYLLLVGCAKLPEGDGDEWQVPDALEAKGIASSWVVWDDPHVDFAAADLVILRATWDYPDRRDEFLAWCDRVPNLRNPVDVVRWNTDKTYLIDLAGAGIRTVPTELVHPGELPSWPDKHFVLKPAIGVGSIGAGRFAPGALEPAAGHLRKLHAAGHTVLLQPYQSNVDTTGETALVFFGGEYSHAFTKAAMLRGCDVDGSGLFVAERLGVADPEPAQRKLAEDALDAAAGLLGRARDTLLYARVDVVHADDGRPALLELELTEPSLGFRNAENGAADRFAETVRRALGEVA